MSCVRPPLHLLLRVDQAGGLEDALEAVDAAVNVADGDDARGGLRGQRLDGPAQQSATATSRATGRIA